MEYKYPPPSEDSPGGPPILLMWLALVALFLIIVVALAGLSFFSGGQRLALLIPYIGIAVTGIALAIIGGAFIYRRRLPRLLWLWASLAIIIVMAGGVAASVWAYQNVLPPRYQEQFVEEIPVLRAFLPPTPQGGVLPTLAATSAISIDDLLSAPLLPPTATAEAQQVIAPTATLPPPTLPPTALPTDTPPPPTQTPPPTSAALMPTAVSTAIVPQVVSSFSRPASSRMYGFTHVQQGWNNCGPANVTMALSYFGWRESQDYAASILRPDREDKNVSPHELVDFVNTQTGVRAITRIGGDLDLLKQFIVNNIPVIIERSYTPEGFDWIGHYQTVVGYDDNARIFYVYDSYLGTGTGGAGLAENYTAFDAGWQAFNRVFIAIYEPDRESVVQGILGERADVNRAAEIALETARAEARADRQNAFAWFNMGAALTRLGNYEEATRYFDEARRLNLPFRMLWYQFYPFQAYYEVGRFDDVLALVNNNLVNGGQYVEETHYWHGRVLAAQGRRSEAVAAFQRALARNRNYTAAQQALNALG